MDKDYQHRHAGESALVQELARKTGVSDREVTAVLTELGLPMVLREFSGFASGREVKLHDVRLSVRIGPGVVAV